MGNPNILNMNPHVQKLHPENKQWLLNAAAIKAARSCIRSVESELGVRLTLSHPDFLALLGEYCELTDSKSLQKAYATLTQYFDRSAVAESAKKSKVSKVSTIFKEQKITSAPKPKANISGHSEVEYVVYKGRKFKRWNGDLEFQGLYRGQPRYS